MLADQSLSLPSTMQQSAPSRKRPAPGASPLVQQPMAAQQQQQQQQPPQYQYPQMPDNPDFSNFDFNNAFPTEQTFADPSLPDTNNFTTTFNANQPPTYGSTIAPAPSTDLVRRARNQQLAPQIGQQEPWNGNFGDTMAEQEVDDLPELKRRAEIAKKEAQNKRKQIPPFVQKLSSFLDNSSNTELIRWSDDGRSFIVLDEDEFARRLIPELFKHNNYASFVRQLNMYGFHKTVNITDGSLRQSEKARKGVKPPSMYSHPYFRRNQQDLLWLIQKPSSKSNAKRKRDGTFKDGLDSDDERQFSPGPDGRPGEVSAAGGQGDLAQMPRGEMAAVRQELKKLQQQQGIISRMIGQLKEQNDQFYRQATAFQALHDRHENSINAILTFLATFYNRSLEGHSGQNLVNMFNNAQNSQDNQQSGVVEEYNESTPENNQQVQKYTKRPQLLLTAAGSDAAQSGNVATQPNSARASVSPPGERSPRVPLRDSTSSVPPTNAATPTAGRNTASPIIKTDAQTPDMLNQVPENDQMLSLINNANATAAGEDPSAPAYDFTAALNSYQNSNGNAPLTAQQRDDMLQMIANQQGGEGSSNNALTMPNMPHSGLNPDDFLARNNQIEQLQEFQQQHANNINRIEKRLGHLSPSGSISGMSGAYNGEGNGFGGNYTIPDDLSGFNFDSYVNDHFNDDLNAENAADLQFEQDHPGMYSYMEGDTGQDMFPADGKVESVSSESPAELDPGTPQKRQRTS